MFLNTPWNHFDEEISLKVLSEVANMTENAFCKYFKKRVTKTYVPFLNELRIERPANYCKIKTTILLLKSQKLHSFQTFRISIGSLNLL